jgi:ATP-dependent DNA helicase RecQ
VTVQTYHGLAMRLTGTSFATLAQTSSPDPAGLRIPDFDALIGDAVRLLTVGGELPGLALDELREQILAGFSHILVDEYQDINRDQYELVSALAGRGERDRERRLAILAVGDDDQNIYGFAGADVGFIRRFREDYRAEVHYLVESYRSTAHILAAANRLIARNRGRMKGRRPIAVDAARRADPPGGRWASLEPAAGGRVGCLRVADGALQAVAIAERLFHMRRIDSELRWEDCAVLARQHAVLEPVRAVLEDRGVPLTWTAERDRLPPLYRIREVAALLAELRERRREILRASQIEELWLRGPAARDPAADGAENPWRSLVCELLAEWREETGDGELAVQGFLEFFCEALVERRRESAFGDGVRLATVHAAKGLEFRHVFLADGKWEPPRDGFPGPVEEEERRLYFVGMTRARETLHLLERRDSCNPHLAGLAGEFLTLREPRLEPPDEAVAGRRFALLGLADLYLSYAGRRVAEAPIHRRLAALQPGDPLRLQPSGDFLLLADREGGDLGALSATGRERWGDRLEAIETIRVVAMVERRAEDSEDEYRARLRCERWEVPVAEVVYRRGDADRE